jgi:hypothetical protein
MKTQLDNLIRFSFNLHNNMPYTSSYDFAEPTYIMEKWEKYIGVIPKSKDLSYYSIIFIPPSADKTNDSIARDWISKWRVDEKTYNEIKEILYFIILLNNKHLRLWTPSDIIELFNDNIGYFCNIKNELAGTLHPLVEDRMENWLNNKRIRRDYNLILLDV